MKMFNNFKWLKYLKIFFDFSGIGVETTESYTEVTNILKLHNTVLINHRSKQAPKNITMFLELNENVNNIPTIYGMPLKQYLRENWLHWQALLVKKKDLKLTTFIYILQTRKENPKLVEGNKIRAEVIKIEMEIRVWTKSISG